MNKLREKIERKEKIYGTLVSMCEPCMCEIMASAGFQAVWIDMEHSYMSCKDVMSHLIASSSAGIPAIVRLPQNDLTVTKKILEMGSDGIIFPQVRSFEELKNLVDMTLYPPYGTRGFGPIRAIKYGAEDAKEYVDKKSFSLCRFVQIEHIDFIEELEKIVEFPYIDGFIFGPNDLSGSLGEMLNVFGDKTISQIKRAVEILRKNNKYIGVACGSDDKIISFWKKLDVDMIFSDSDWIFVHSAGKRVFENISMTEQTDTTVKRSGLNG